MNMIYHLKAALRKSLALDCTKTVKLSLKVHARLMVSPSHFTVKESYMNLVETVSSWYKDRRLFQHMQRRTIAEDGVLHANMISVLALLGTVNRELPKLWVRLGFLRSLATMLNDKY